MPTVAQQGSAEQSVQQERQQSAVQEARHGPLMIQHSPHSQLYYSDCPCPPVLCPQCWQSSNRPAAHHICAAHRRMYTAMRAHVHSVLLQQTNINRRECKADGSAIMSTPKDQSMRLCTYMPCAWLMGAQRPDLKLRPSTMAHKPTGLAEKTRCVSMSAPAKVLQQKAKLPATTVTQFKEQRPRVGRSALYPCLQCGCNLFSFQPCQQQTSLFATTGLNNRVSSKLMSHACLLAACLT
jgi:hypothetical protein